MSARAAAVTLPVTERSRYILTQFTYVIYENVDFYIYVLINYIYFI